MLKKIDITINKNVSNMHKDILREGSNTLEEIFLHEDNFAWKDILAQRVIFALEVTYVRRVTFAQGQFYHSSKKK